MPKPRITPPMRQALWIIQKDGGLILTVGADIETPYTTRQARPVHARTVQALIAAKELTPEDGGILGDKPTAWQVAHPVDMEPV